MRIESHHLPALFVLAVFIITGCDMGSSTGSSISEESCEGPIPCATEDWGDTILEFDEDTLTILLHSDGEIFSTGFLVEGPYLMTIAGEVKDCNFGKITFAGLDYNTDGIVDDWYDSADGNAYFCGSTLRLTHVYLDETRYYDFYATYVGIRNSGSTQTNQDDGASAIIYDALDMWRNP